MTTARSSFEAANPLGAAETNSTVPRKSREHGCGSGTCIHGEVLHSNHLRRPDEDLEPRWTWYWRGSRHVSSYYYPARPRGQLSLWKIVDTNPLLMLGFRDEMLHVCSTVPHCMFICFCDRALSEFPRGNWASTLFPLLLPAELLEIQNRNEISMLC